MGPIRVKEYFDYNPEDGILRWKINKAKRIRAGMPVGYINNGTRLVATVDYCHYRVHQLVWLWFYGEWPNSEIDHINGNGLDNRIENLRRATRQQNAQNVPMHCDNELGFRGVSRSRDKFVARIQGKRLGLFSSPEEASAAYEAAAKEIYGEFHRAISRPTTAT